MTLLTSDSILVAICLSHAKIASALDVPVATVRSLVARARRRLKPLLAEFAPDSAVSINEVFEEHAMITASRTRFLHVANGTCTTYAASTTGIPHTERSVQSHRIYSSPQRHHQGGGRDGCSEPASSADAESRWIRPATIFSEARTARTLTGEPYPAGDFTKIPDFTVATGTNCCRPMRVWPVPSRNSKLPCARSKIATSAVTPGVSVPIFSG